jgi:phosphonatase-like hydrolase
MTTRELVDELKLVVFDMAGTTVLDGGEVPAAFSAALAEQGISVTKEQLNAVRGASKRQAVLSLMPDGPQRQVRADAAYAAFKKDLARRYADGVRPVPGAAQTFGWLRERGVRVALNTGFDREITELLLAGLGWARGVVDAIVCGDEVRRGRPAPQLIFRCMEATEVDGARSIAVVGDTTLDLQAGRNAGARWNIGVLSGAHSRELLEQQPHTHLLSSVAELPTIFTRAAESTYVTSEADLPTESFEWGTLKWLCNGKLSPGAAQTVGICHILPGRRNPLHYHPNCEEVLYMVAGQGVHTLDETAVSLRAGSTIRIPAGVKHNLANNGAEAIECLISFSSGERETIFLE